MLLKENGYETMFPQNGDSYMNHFSSTVKISSYYMRGARGTHSPELTSGVLLNDGKHIISSFHDNSDYQDPSYPKSGKSSGPDKRYLTESMTQNITESNKKELFKRSNSVVTVYGSNAIAYELEPVCSDPDFDLILFKIVDSDKNINPFKRITSPVGFPMAGMNITRIPDDVSQYDAIHMISYSGCYGMQNQRLQTSLGNYVSHQENAEIFGNLDENYVQCFGFSLNGAIKAHANLSDENKIYSLKIKLEQDFENKIGLLQTGNDGCGFQNGTYLKSPISSAHSSSGGGVSVVDNEIVAVCSGWDGNSFCGVISKSSIMMKALEDSDIV